MNSLWNCLIFLALVAGTLHAEDSPRRKRRFITYDGPPARVTTEAPEGTSGAVNQSEGQRELERETSRPESTSNRDVMPRGMSMLPAPIPGFMTEEEEEEEEEEESWITPQDLMSTDDLLEMDLTSEQGEETVEMEIVEWDTLQEAMIEEEMQGVVEDGETEQEESVELRQEEAEAAFQEEVRSSGDDEAGGLQMESMMETQTMDLEPESRTAAMENAERDGEPLLQPVRLAGENGPVVIGTPDTSSQTLSGSREMLTNLQSRWDPRQRSDAPAPADRPQPASIQAENLRDPFASRPSVSPAPELGSVRSGTRIQPAAPVLDTAPPRRQEPIRREPTDRIQSRLGAGSF